MDRCELGVSCQGVVIVKRMNFLEEMIGNTYLSLSLEVHICFLLVESSDLVSVLKFAVSP